MILDPDHPGHILRQDGERISLRRVSDSAPQARHPLMHNHIDKGTRRPTLSTYIGENAIADRSIVIGQFWVSPTNAHQRPHQIGAADDADKLFVT
jgi:hypothetical protein